MITGTAFISLISCTYDSRLSLDVSAVGVITYFASFKISALDGLGVKDYPTGIIAAGALLTYLYETQKSDMSHIITLTPYTTGKYMLIDSSSRRNLELVETLREKQKRGSLIWVLDKTKTAMGARALRSMIEQPLINKDEIINRQNVVEELCNNQIDREELREYMLSLIHI